MYVHIHTLTLARIETERSLCHLPFESFLSQARNTKRIGDRYILVNDTKFLILVSRSCVTQTWSQDGGCPVMVILVYSLKRLGVRR